MLGAALGLYTLRRRRRFTGYSREGTGPGSGNERCGSDVGRETGRRRYAPILLNTNVNFGPDSTRSAGCSTQMSRVCQARAYGGGALSLALQLNVFGYNPAYGSRASQHFTLGCTSGKSIAAQTILSSPTLCAVHRVAETGWNGLVTKREMDVRTYGPSTYLPRDQAGGRTRVLFEEYDILFSRQILPMTN